MECWVTLHLYLLRAHFAVEVFFKADWSEDQSCHAFRWQKYSSKVSFFAYPLRINKVTSQFFNGKWWFPTMKVMAKHHYCQVFPARQGSNAINVKVLGIFASLLAEYSQSSPGGFNTLFGGVGVRGWVGHQWTLTVFIKRWLFGNTSSIVACSPPHFPPPPTTMSVKTVVSFGVGPSRAVAGVS